ncbi:MAG: EF2563 family selenium-dependent molybdenum hydroxylase system protein [Spirochaetes bacterium]|nr:EF2563 family selenium-dependent molybdenum hydroxylase system protein [Spirochaetota bacterium]
MNILSKAAELAERNMTFAMATIIEAKGSTPRRSAKMIILADGSTEGTIGGGPAELTVINQAKEAIQNGQSRVVHYTLDNTSKTDSLNMECGGSLQVFIEIIGSRPELILLGGGHVNLAIAEMAAFLDFNITVVDTRPELTTTQRFPMAANIIQHKNLTTAIQQLKIHNQSYIVIATNDSDEEALRGVIQSQSPYIGMLGSKRKIATIFQHLRKEGIAEQRLKSLYTPVGLSIGSETPAEIALSILTEITMVKNGKSGQPLSAEKQLIIVRGGGDIASGTIAKFHRSGFEVVVLETEFPTFIRRNVSFGQAIFDNEVVVEDIKAKKASNLTEITEFLDKGWIPVLIDPDGKFIDQLKPVAVIDAMLAKTNKGTHLKMAPIVIGLGPGFEAGTDVQAVIETNRGHFLGTVIYSGSASENTGIPGNIEGFTSERVIRSTADGKVLPSVTIGDMVGKGDVVARTNDVPVYAEIGGIIRGMINPGSEVTMGHKIGDIDPRGELKNCTTISDKSRAVAGGALEAFLSLKNRK